VRDRLSMKPRLKIPCRLRDGLSWDMHALSRKTESWEGHHVSVTDDTQSPERMTRIAAASASRAHGHGNKSATEQRAAAIPPHTKLGQKLWNRQSDSIFHRADACQL